MSELRAQFEEHPLLTDMWVVYRRLAGVAGEFELRARLLAGLDPEASFGGEDGVIAALSTRFPEIAPLLQAAYSLRNQVLHGRFAAATEALEKMTGEHLVAGIVRGNANSIIMAVDAGPRELHTRLLEFHFGGAATCADQFLWIAINRVRERGGERQRAIDAAMPAFRDVAGVAGLFELRARLLAGVTEDITDPHPREKFRHLLHGNEKRQGLLKQYSESLTAQDVYRITTAVDLRDAILHAQPARAIQILEGRAVSCADVFDEVLRFSQSDRLRRAEQALSEAVELLEDLLWKNVEQTEEMMAQRSEEERAADRERFVEVLGNMVASQDDDDDDDE
jgi:hypothetical protein